MSRIGDWLETISGTIFEVESETETDYKGREIEYNAFKPLRYGKLIVVPKNEVIYDDEIYDWTKTESVERAKIQGNIRIQ